MSLRARLEAEAGEEWEFPEVESEAQAAARATRSQSRWRRLVRRLYYFQRTFAQHSVLNLWMAIGMQTETAPEEEAPPTIRPRANKKPSARHPHRDDLVFMSYPLPRSTARKHDVEPNRCQRPVEKIRARGGMTYWWTCEDCGSRWERTAAPEEVESQETSGQYIGPMDGSPEEVPRPRRAPIQPRLPTASVRGAAAAEGGYRGTQTGHLGSHQFGPAPFRPSCGTVMTLRQNRAHFVHVWVCSMYPNFNTTLPAHVAVHHNIGADSPRSTAGMSTSSGVSPDNP